MEESANTIIIIQNFRPKNLKHVLEILPRVYHCYNNCFIWPLLYLSSLFSSCPRCFNVMTANLTNQKILNIIVLIEPRGNQNILGRFCFLTSSDSVTTYGGLKIKTSTFPKIWDTMHSTWEENCHDLISSQGSKKTPSGRLGQVDFPFGQVTFSSSLPHGKGPRQAVRRLNFW